MKTSTRAAVVLLVLGAAGPAIAQEPPPPTPTPAVAAPDAGVTPEEEAKKESIPFRPIEANVIIDLPSVEVPPAGTLTFLVTHRFQTPIQDASINNFFTLDNGNDWGFGLWYAPLKKLNLGFYRTSDFNIYEASAQYEFPNLGGFQSSLRVGEDWRTETGLFGAASPKSSFFTQGILAYSFGKYVRITAVPTYLQRTNFARVNTNDPPPGDRSCRANPPDSQLPYSCSGLYENLFNVPVGLSIAITHSITVHGEVTPRIGRANATGVGWAVSLEKSLLRHRFAFFAGNQRATTVDQYTAGILRTPFSGANPKNVYIGFNLYRAWKLN